MAICSSELENLVGEQETEGDLSPNMVDSEIEDSNLANQEADGDASHNMQDSEIEDSNLVGEVKTEGEAAPAMVDSEIEDSNWVDEQKVEGKLNNAMVDSEIEDSNWADRVLEMYNGLVQRDPQLPLALLEIPGFGHPGHVQFVASFDTKMLGNTPYP